MPLRFVPHTFALLLSSTAVALAAGGGFKEFQTWQVTCSQALDCSMRQFFSNASISQVEFRRAAGPDTPLSIVVSMADAEFSDDASDVTGSIMIDDAQPLSIAKQDIHFDPIEAAWILSGDFIGNGLVASLKNGTRMRLGLTRGTTLAEGTVALAGVAASLLFIDDQQMRVGHSDALSARGDKPPSPAIPFHNIRSFDAFPEAIRLTFAEGGACEDTEESQLDGNAFVHLLSDKEAIYATPCGTPGAYNFPYALFVDNFGSVTRMAFPVMQEGAPSATDSAYNLDYDFETRKLNAFFRGRGIGDCGSYNEWHLSSNQGGPVLVLDRETSKDCDGDDLGGPQNWPSQWPRK